MYLDRNWKIRETEEVGTVITRVHGSDSEGGSLEYGLEPLQFYGTNKKPERLPFRIDSATGVVYLNESLVGRVRMVDSVDSLTARFTRYPEKFRFLRKIYFELCR